ncbi:MAG: D-alanine--D-alanine ligase [Myxococcales bacterium]|nr:D-alanine--D-alanine ligase [Myxococcales bacterium]
MNTFLGKRIGVVMGGLSAEREVSLSSGRGVLRGLLEHGHNAVAIEWGDGQELATMLRAERVDAVWNALHGTYGEDGCVQGLLECMRIPYTGSGVLASAIAMDKVATKRIFDRGGVPTPEWTALAPGDSAHDVARRTGWPVVVKPSREGSSVGVTIVEREEDLDAAVTLADGYHGVTLVERFIPGREVQVGLLDDEVLGTVEIRPKSGFYDYEAKYVRKDTEYLVPAPLDSALDTAARAASLAAYRLLGCAGHARVDCRIDPSGGVFVLEVNTLPGMTATSLLPKIAAHAGLDYANLVDRILRTAALRE